MSYYILHVFVAVNTILVSATLFTISRRKGSAAWRYGIWVGAMLGIIAVPLFIPLLPQHAIFIRPETSVNTIEELPGSTVHSIYLSQESKNSVASDTSEKTTTEVNSHKNGFLYNINPVYLISGIWLAGFVLAMFSISRDFVFARKYICEGLENDERTIDFLVLSIRKKLRISRQIRIFRHPRVKAPFTFGLARPVVFLAENSSEMSDEELEAILLHEFSHIARNDVLWQTVARFAAAIYWFHPLVWYGLHRMRIERELACDNAVLHHGTSPNGYATTLLEVAASIQGSEKTPANLIAMARTNYVQNRIAAILDPVRSRRPLGKIRLVLIVAILFMSVLTLAMLAPLGPWFPPILTVSFETEEFKKYAIPEGTPDVVIEGRVLMPDGSPAVGFTVGDDSVGIFASRDGKNFTIGNGITRLGYSPIKSDAEGKFRFKVTPGINTMLYLIDEKAGSLVAPPLVFIPDPENNEEKILQLEEGVPVRISLKFEDGQPLRPCDIQCTMPIKPLIGEDAVNIVNNFKVSVLRKSDDQGRCELFLPPGEFVFVPYHLGPEDVIKSKTARIVTEKPTEIEFVIPNPTRIKLHNPEGTPLSHKNVTRSWIEPKDHRGTMRTPNFIERKTDENGEIPLFLNHRDFYIAVNDGGEFGIVTKITKADDGKTITLRKNAGVKLKLIDKKTKVPIKGERISCSRNYTYRSPDINVGGEDYGVATTQTDENGEAILRIPFIEAADRPNFQYELRFSKIDNIEFTLRDRETPLDLGTIEIP